MGLSVFRLLAARYTFLLTGLSVFRLSAARYTFLLTGVLVFSYSFCDLSKQCLDEIFNPLFVYHDIVYRAPYLRSLVEDSMKPVYRECFVEQKNQLVHLISITFN